MDPPRSGLQLCNGQMCYGLHSAYLYNYTTSKKWTLGIPIWLFNTKVPLNHRHPETTPPKLHHVNEPCVHACTDEESDITVIIIINVFPTLWSITQSNCIPTTRHAILDIRIQYHRGNHQCLHSGTRSQCITCTWSWLAARINFMIRRWDFLVIKGRSSKESSTGTLQCAQLNGKLDSYDSELGLWDWPRSYALLWASVKEQTSAVVGHCSRRQIYYTCYEICSQTARESIIKFLASL